MSKEEKPVVTRYDVEALKADWVKSGGDWELQSTNGFEEYRAELAEFEAAKYAEWEQVRRRATEARAKIAGLPVDVFEKVEDLEHTAKISTNSGKTNLLYYFEMIAKESGLRFDSDMRAEVFEICDFLVEAAVAKMKAEILREAHKK